MADRLDGHGLLGQVPLPDPRGPGQDGAGGERPHVPGPGRADPLRRGAGRRGAHRAAPGRYGRLGRGPVQRRRARHRRVADRREGGADAHDHRAQAHQLPLLRLLLRPHRHGGGRARGGPGARPDALPLRFAGHGRVPPLAHEPGRAGRPRPREPSAQAGGGARQRPVGARGVGRGPG